MVFSRFLGVLNGFQMEALVNRAADRCRLRPLRFCREKSPIALPISLERAFCTPDLTANLLGAIVPDLCQLEEGFKQLQLCRGSTIKRLKLSQSCNPLVMAIVEEMSATCRVDDETKLCRSS